VAAADLGVVGDELDPFDPLDLLEAELDFVSEPERGAMTERQVHSPAITVPSELEGPGASSRQRWPVVFLACAKRIVTGPVDPLIPAVEPI
jgi:hypothetical protein